MLEKKKIFYLKETEEPNRYTLAIDYDLAQEFYIKSTEGSYNVLFARLMNMDYPTWLRFCRDIVGAELVGKNHLYVYPIFKKTSETVQFVDLLNTQMNLVKWEKDHPNWREHAEYLEERRRFNGKY